MMAFVASLGEPDFDEISEYQIEDNPRGQTRREILPYLFNHETHRHQGHGLASLPTRCGTFLSLDKS